MQQSTKVTMCIYGVTDAQKVYSIDDRGALCESPAPIRTTQSWNAYTLQMIRVAFKSACEAPGVRTVHTDLTFDPPLVSTVSAKRTWPAEETGVDDWFDVYLRTVDIATWESLDEIVKGTVDALTYTDKILHSAE